jgi:hypothetical protein
LFRFRKIINRKYTFLRRKYTAPLHRDSEMDGTVVHNLDTEQTVSQIYDTQVLKASNAWLQEKNRSMS